ncbi:MAG: FG-GAP repeat domain-containing protein, partial [Candidatus Woesearchaeota archaeon]
MKKTFLIAILILTLTLAISSSSYVEDTSIQLTGLKHSSQAWGDFNLDGNWDLAICGEANNPKTIIYEFNSNGQPIQKDFEIINVTRCSINWADINNNGWDDLTISGINHDGIFLKIYKNINGTKFQEYQNLTGVAYSNTLYGDLNNNGWLDLVAIGCNEVHNATPTKNIHNCNKIISRVYINNNGTLEYSEQWSSNLANVWKGSIALGDYTNNGFLDLALSGTTTNTSSGAITHLYMNNGTTFNLDENNILEGIFWGSLAFSDYNNNGNLDLFITGRNSSGQPITKIFQNDVHIYKNHSMPIPPTDIKLDVNDGKIHVSWNTEQEEPLSFNLKAYYYRYQVGTSTIIDTKYAVSPLYPISSNPSQGYFGNMLNKQSYRFDSPNRCTYVQIQTVDASMRKSEWSEPVNISFTSNRGSGYDEDCRGSDQPTIAQLGGGGGGTQVEAYQEYIRAEEERRAQEELTPFETDQT